MTIIFFLFLLLIIVIIHELGHLIVAKIFGVYCHEFSFGMGPLITQKKIGETVYSLRALPLGGFVSMAGDSDGSVDPEKEKDIPIERTLKGCGPIKKLLIFYAGIFMNFVLALVIAALVFLSYGVVSVSPDSTIAEVTKDSIAYKAGILPGDKVTAISLPDGSRYTVRQFDEIVTYFSLYEGEGEVTFEIEREGKDVTISFTPLFNEEEERYMVGIAAKQFETANVNIFNCWKYAFDYLITISSAVISSLLNLLRGVGLDNLSGPIGIYSVTETAINEGIGTYFLLIAMVSVNVGLINLLPIPVMDGGRALLLIIEVIIGRPLNEKISNAILTGSAILLILLFILMTIKDVANLL